eukprot:g47911.t1
MKSIVQTAVERCSLSNRGGNCSNNRDDRPTERNIIIPCAWSNEFSSASELSDSCKPLKKRSRASTDVEMTSPGCREMNDSDSRGLLRYGSLYLFKSAVEIQSFRIFWVERDKFVIATGLVGYRNALGDYCECFSLVFCTDVLGPSIIEHADISGASSS